MMSVAGTTLKYCVSGAQNNSCKHEEKKEKFSEKNKQNVDGLTEMNNVVEGGSHDNAKFNFNAGDVIVREGTFRRN